MLPFAPEPIEQMQARFADALTPVYDVRVLMRQTNPSDSIGKKRKHVFDFEDGIRLIVSMETDPESSITRVAYLHASMSSFNGLKMNRTDVTAFCTRLLTEMSQGRLLDPHVQVSEGGIPHFFYDSKPLYGKLTPEEQAKVASAWLGQARIR